ncbi:OB-fold domain-containing protein [Actinomadura madurae]|uniref:DUF35 domain-containing protein n=1 Tax=Actinomadura madurae TaxID=1993 RepID=A0A1I5P7Z4_9ACTN|nr:OB-fold domain-containing protein [Actinomadura madurae]SFP30093.1 hypothetical protein SAMN04489713_11330 [Actinomadura madurae]
MSEATEPLPGSAKPLPDVDDPLTAPFWAAARESRLVLPRCTHCSYLQWPPEPVCPECRHTGRAWHEFPARGRLWSFAVYHRALDPAFAADVPYAVGLIELDAGRKMYGTMVGDPDALRVGRRVRAVFDPVNEDVTFVRWEVDDPEPAT